MEEERRLEEKKLVSDMERVRREGLRASKKLQRFESQDRIEYEAEAYQEEQERRRVLHEMDDSIVAEKKASDADVTERLKLMKQQEEEEARQRELEIVETQKKQAELQKKVSSYFEVGPKSRHSTCHSSSLSTPSDLWLN